MSVRLEKATEETFVSSAANPANGRCISEVWGDFGGDSLMNEIKKRKRTSNDDLKLKSVSVMS